MSATTIRASIAAFVSAPAITNLAKVYADYPWRIAGTALAITPTTNFGAVAWPHIAEQHEKRITFPAGTGSKEVTYAVDLIVVAQYRIPPTATAGDEWVAPADTLLDAIVARLRSDQKIGTGPSSSILQAGEGDEQLKIRRDMPRIDGGILHVWTAVSFSVTEIVTG